MAAGQACARRATAEGFVSSPPAVRVRCRGMLPAPTSPCRAVQLRGRRLPPAGGRAAERPCPRPCPAAGLSGPVPPHRAYGGEAKWVFNRGGGDCSCASFSALQTGPLRGCDKSPLAFGVSGLEAFGSCCVCSPMERLPPPHPTG